MCCFKRATFCIIQREVKFRSIWLLTLVKVHIMLCTFKNGTIKSLILTLNIFKRFFFQFFFFFSFIWLGITTRTAKILQGLTSKATEILHGMASNAAEILQGTTSNAAEILQGLTAQPCRNSAWYGVQWCRNSAGLQNFCKVWRPMLFELQDKLVKITPQFGN